MRTIKFKWATIYWDGAGLPFIVFNDGKATYALPRQPVETESLGYTDVALGNFEHEAIHIFVTEKLMSDEGLYDSMLGDTMAKRWQKQWVADSVLRRAADGVEFVDQALEDAIFEESLVLGIQIAMNKHQECDAEGNTSLPGFCFHMARGCYMNAKRELAQLGLDIDKLAQEIKSILRPEEGTGETCPVGYNCLEVPRHTKVQREPELQTL
jgi:hypothetical protein